MNSAAILTSFAMSILLYSGFDSSFDADYSNGNGTAIVINDRYAPVLTTGDSGRFGEAVEFTYDTPNLETVWTRDTVRYQAKSNFPYSVDKPFDGAVGMWLMIDMDELLKRDLIWLDPIHLLSDDMTVARDSGKIWMDFVTKELDGSPLFRFGATLPKHARKNPKNNGEGHVITVPGIDFREGEWHHVIGTWKNLNAEDNSGIIRLYFDGKKVAEIDSFAHPLSWNIENWELRLGIGFAGKIDEFFTSSTFIDDETAQSLFKTKTPLKCYITNK